MLLRARITELENELKQIPSLKDEVAIFVDVFFHNWFVGLFTYFGYIDHQGGNARTVIPAGG